MQKICLTALLCAGAWWPLVGGAQAVRVVTETSAYVYMEGDKVAGPATEVLEKTLQRAGIRDYRLQIYPWARAYDMALAEPNVLIYLIARTPEREKQFKWVGEFMRVHYHLYKLRERSDIKADTLEAARNYVIGVMRDDLRHQYLRKQGFTRLVVSAQVAENFAQLTNRQVDLLPLSESGAASLCREAHFDCGKLEKLVLLDEMSTGLYMAYSAGTADELVARTQAAFEQLNTNGSVRRLMETRPALPKTASASSKPG